MYWRYFFTVYFTLSVAISQQIDTDKEGDSIYYNRV